MGWAVTLSCKFVNFSLKMLLVFFNMENNLISGLRCMVLAQEGETTESKNACLKNKHKKIRSTPEFSAPEDDYC